MATTLFPPPPLSGGNHNSSSSDSVVLIVNQLIQRVRWENLAFEIPLSRCGISAKFSHLTLWISWFTLTYKQACLNPYIHWTIHLSFHLSIHPPIHQSIPLSPHSSICLSVRPFIHLSIHLSIPPSIHRLLVNKEIKQLYKIPCIYSIDVIRIYRWQYYD